jgi:hypothetical protein
MSSFIDSSPRGFLKECPQPIELYTLRSDEPDGLMERSVSKDQISASHVEKTRLDGERADVISLNSSSLHSGELSIDHLSPNIRRFSNSPPLLKTCNDFPNLHYLIGKWDLYYHLPYIKKWDIDSYTIIMKDIDTLEKLVSINKCIPDLIIKQCMLFVMKNGITPRWEDPKNRNGGCFSFKVVNKFVPSVWKSLFYCVCGESVFENPSYNNLINGITISPKKNFCIIKIWMVNCSVQDPSLIVQIPNLVKQGCLFNKHEVEE